MSANDVLLWLLWDWKCGLGTIDGAFNLCHLVSALRCMSHCSSGSSFGKGLVFWLASNSFASVGLAGGGVLVMVENLQHFIWLSLKDEWWIIFFHKAIDWDYNDVKGGWFQHFKTCKNMLSKGPYTSSAYNSSTHLKNIQCRASCARVWLGKSVSM